MQDFPFLRHHKTRKGVITMENNEMVAVCLDCYDTLRSQFNESERYGIPLEKRQYNWMQVTTKRALEQPRQTASPPQPPNRQPQ